MTLRVGVQGPVFDGPTDFSKLMAGAGVFTTTSAVEALPVPPLLELTVTELLLSSGDVLMTVPVTLTENVQLAPAAKFAPERLIVVEPAIAVIVPPPHEPDKPFGVATTKPL